MNSEIVVSPEAESDLLDAVKWYEGNLKGLGSNFLLQVDAGIQSLSNNPNLYPKVYKNIRRALVRKFPFGIYYIKKENKIVILAVFHFRRNPNNWKSRKP